MKAACPCWSGRQALAKDQLDAVTKLIETKLKVKPDLTTEVDPRILGGLWMRVGDKVYDRSVRWNLNQLRESILTRSSHEIQSGRDIVDHSTGN
ncbi:MAG: F0F1 ATP synthase subunit delta [Planctomycetota bacterium]